MVCRNLTTQLMLHDRITTTLAKAKELRPWVEKLIIKAKQGGYNSNQHLVRTLFTKEAIRRVRKDIVPRYQ